jgi:hypothetical protein
MMFLLIGTVANAQLSFLPQIGFEQSRTTLNYGDALSTSGISGNFKASLKMDYRLKGGHSPFINVSTTPAPVSFVFNESGSLMNNYQAAKNNLQLRLEAGYQYSSSPIQFKKKGSVSKSNAPEINNENIVVKKSCGSATYKSHCDDKKRNSKNPLNNDVLSMRLQPSLALAYIPSAGESLTQTANGFEYNAANWKTAVVPAMGFEFAKGRQRLFTLSIFYTKPLGEYEETVTSFSGNKAIITPLNPKASTWGMTLGVPFSFAKSNAVKIKKVKRTKEDCNKSYYRKCGKVQQ